MKHKLKYYGLSLPVATKRCVVGLTAAAAIFVAVPAPAQQINGTPGSPSATVTIDGKELPPPPFTLTAKLNKLTIKVDRPQIPPQEIKKLEEAMKQAADAK